MFGSMFGSGLLCPASLGYRAAWEGAGKRLMVGWRGRECAGAEAWIAREARVRADSEHEVRAAPETVCSFRAVPRMYHKRSTFPAIVSSAPQNLAAKV